MEPSLPWSFRSFSPSFSRFVHIFILFFIQGVGAAISTNYGWQYSFYFSAICGFVWMVPFSLLVFDSPSNFHGSFSLLSISDDEKDYILSNQDMDTSDPGKGGSSNAINSSFYARVNPTEILKDIQDNIHSKLLSDDKYEEVDKITDEDRDDKVIGLEESDEELSTKAKRSEEREEPDENSGSSLEGDSDIGEESNEKKEKPITKRKKKSKEENLTKGDHKAMEKEAEEASGTPWKRLLTSPAVLTLAFNHFACTFPSLPNFLPFICSQLCFILDNWGFYVFLSWLPTYLKRELSFDLKQSGLLSFLPYLILPVISTIGGVLVDFFSKRGITSRISPFSSSRR